MRTSYYVQVLGTEEDEDTKHTKQTWGSYIKDAETEAEAAAEAVTQYIEMRTLDAFTPVAAYVLLPDTDGECVRFNYLPHASHDWCADAKGSKWQMT